MQDKERSDAEFRREGFSWGNTSVVDGDAALGSDGNAYVLRATSRAVGVRNIGARRSPTQPTGRISGGVSARKIMSARGQLAIRFLEGNSTAKVMKVIDYSGDEVATFVPTDVPAYPGNLVCFDGEAFTSSVTDEEDKLRLSKVVQVGPGALRIGPAFQGNEGLRAGSYGFWVGLSKTSLANDCGACITSIATTCATSSG